MPSRESQDLKIGVGRLSVAGVAWALVRHPRETERCSTLADLLDKQTRKNSPQRDRAEARFAATKTRAKVESDEEARAGYEKTAKLKSLRLAKEAAEAAEKALQPPKKKRSPRTAGATKRAPTRG